MLVNDTGMATEIASRCRNMPTEEDLASCALEVLRDRKHNKFFQVKRGELRNVIEVSIIDEEEYKEEVTLPRKKIVMTTTQGKYDPDYLNWYAVIEPIDKEEDALVLVKKNIW